MNLRRRTFTKKEKPYVPTLIDYLKRGIVVNISTSGFTCEQAVQNLYQGKPIYPQGYKLLTFSEWSEICTTSVYAWDDLTRQGTFTFSDGFVLMLPASGYNEAYRGTEGVYWYDGIPGKNCIKFTTQNRMLTALSSTATAFMFCIPTDLNTPIIPTGYHLPSLTEFNTLRDNSTHGHDSESKEVIRGFSGSSVNFGLFSYEAYTSDGKVGSYGQRGIEGWYWCSNDSYAYWVAENLFTSKNTDKNTGHSAILLPDSYSSISDAWLRSVRLVKHWTQTALL